ncbi:ATP-binding protein, partial [Paenibacillus turpanensis]|uniref:ATP-binding protein n=1 Tax=Paenibacillus turpanensis TaxID=2689078 RepID=UPI003C7E91B8
QERGRDELRLRSADGRLQELLRRAAAADGEQLRAKEKQRQERAALSEEYLRLQAKVDALLPEERRDELHAVPAAGGQEALERQLAEAREQQRQLEAERDALNQRIGSVQRQLQELSAAEARAALRQQLLEEEESMKRLARSWITQALAKSLIERTKQHYEQQRQPHVLRTASRYLEALTAGRYTKVLSPFGQSELLVDRFDGERLVPAELSRGTAEQLYLAMRLALADEMAKTTGMLPIVMDDIFVNFDERRTENAIKLLSELSENRQFLLFTCHARIVTMVERHAPKAGIVRLDHSS